MITNNAAEVSPALPGPPSEADLSEQVVPVGRLGQPDTGEKQGRALPGGLQVPCLREINPVTRALVLGT